MRRFRLSPPLADLLLAGLLLTLGGASQAIAQEDPSGRHLWLRYPAVSPDGQHIAFTYRGQLWRVASRGGEAVDEVATPEPFVNGLVKAHDRRVAQRQGLTEQLSKGRLGYVYIAGMDTANYQRFVNDLFGRYADKTASSRSGANLPTAAFTKTPRINPGVLVRRSPDAIEESRDEQLEHAVAHLLGQLGGSATNK